MNALIDAVRDAVGVAPIGSAPVTPGASNVADTTVAVQRPHAPAMLILADDLSGAADCAATSVRHGASAGVALSAADAASGGVSDPRIDVLAIDLDSRRMRAADAAAVHRNAVAPFDRRVRDARGTSAYRQRATRIFKKVDSTLRGHFAAEVAALVPALGLAIVAPAMPEAGRTTVGGRQLLHGVPVEECEVWRNENIPGKADMVVMLRDAGLRVRHQGVAAPGEDAGRVWRNAIEAARRDGIDAMVCDAVTKADLDAIAGASTAAAGVFWVGAAGLARSLTQALSATGLFRAAAQAAAPALTAPGLSTAEGHGALFVVGSMSSVSHGQIAALREAAGDTLHHIEIRVAALLDASDLSDTTGPAEKADAMARAAALLRDGHDVVISLAQGDRTRVGDGYRLAQAFGGWLSPLVASAAAVFATGGETARALLASARITRFTLETEIAPGVPLSWASTETWAADGQCCLPLVTKAGAFGDKDTLVQVWRHLKQTPLPR